MPKQVNCIILDDEPYAVELLKSHVQKVSYLNLIYGGSDVFKAIELLKLHKVDLIFIDIQMPKITGIEFMEMADKDQNFIVTSAYPEYALESFNFNVIDYLMKPIYFRRFHKSLEKYLDWRNQFSENASEEDLFVKSDRKIYRISLDRISHIEGLGDYLRIHTEDEKITVHETMKDMVKRLPSSKFLRIHRSAIIGTQHIKVLDGNTITLTNGTQLTVGETYRQQVHQFFS